MLSRFARGLAGLVLSLALCLVMVAKAEVAVPALAARVTDLTGTLNTSQRSALEGELQAIEARSTSQIAVLMLPTTKPETIEQYSIRVVEAWKLGQKGKDNGVLVLVAKDDRKVRIEVGYGLEGVIPDVIARQVVDGLITPRFKQGDFAGGLMAGVRQLASLIEGPTVADASVTALPSLNGEVMDLTGTLTQEQSHALGKTLREIGMDRGRPFFVLIVPTTAPDTIAQYGARVLAQWGAYDKLDIARSGVLVVAKDDATAHIELGQTLQAKWAAGANEMIVSAIVEPKLKSGDHFAAVQDGVQAIGKQIDAVIAKQSFGERLIEWDSDMPIVLLIAVVLVGTALRWVFGPLIGALTTGGLVGAGAWIIFGTIETALLAGGLSFIFILVGVLNWLALALNSSSGGGSGRSSSGWSSSSSRSGGSGFSGGGGSFGGGGASGGW